MNKHIWATVTQDKKDRSSVVNTPSHYIDGRKYEPIDVIYDWGLDFTLGNCVKYISRLGRKDDTIQDINKALFYLMYKCKKVGLSKENALKTLEQIYSKM